jgi:four helix bundle protein
MSISGLEKLDVWKNSMEYAIRVHKEFIPLLPVEEKWSLAQQIRRSAQSIPANIAEGHGRFYYQDNIRFCYIARGSLEETLSHIAFARKMEYIPTGLYQSLGIAGEELNKLINGYIGFLKQSKRGANEPGANFSVRESESEYVVSGAELAPSDSINE